MFSRPSLVFKDGELIVEDGRIVKVMPGRTHVVTPEYDPEIERRLSAYFEQYHTVKLSNFKISADEMAEGICSPVVVHPCRDTRKS